LTAVPHPRFPVQSHILSVGGDALKTQTKQTVFSLWLQIGINLPYKLKTACVSFSPALPCSSLGREPDRTRGSGFMVRRGERSLSWSCAREKREREKGLGV